MPKVSVIIPTYNAAQYISQAIDSVLAQNYTDFEIIVVDDGSTDNTSQVLAPYQNYIHYIYQENQKLPTARNTGVAVSKGEYLAFLDSDDILLPNKLAIQVAALDIQPKVGLVASGYQYVDEHGQLFGEVRPWLHQPVVDLETLLFKGLAPVHAVLVRHSWFDKIGGFDPSLPYCEDMDFWYRLNLSGCAMVWEPGIVCQYRIHDSNMSRNPKKHSEAFFSVIDKLFSRADLPIYIYKQRDELYAELRLAEVGRLYGAGFIEEAKTSFQVALTLNPSLRVEGANRLLDAIVDWHKSFWIRDRDQFFERVFANLPPEISFSVSQQKQIYLNSIKAKFYDAFEAGNIEVVRRSWINVARQDPAWLFNRGSWSILLQSFM